MQRVRRLATLTRCTVVSVVVVVVALAGMGACRDTAGLERVVAIRARAERLIVVEGGSAPIDSLFDGLRADSVQLRGSGAFRVRAAAAGWSVRGDSVYAPANGESRTTISAEADGVRATIEAVAVRDLARRRWSVSIFCECRPYCSATLATRRDSALTVATVDAVRRPTFALYDAGSVIYRGLESRWVAGSVRYESYISTSDFRPLGLGSESFVGLLGTPGPAYPVAFLQTAPDTVNDIPLRRPTPLRYERTAPAAVELSSSCHYRADRPSVIEER